MVNRDPQSQLLPSVELLSVVVVARNEALFLPGLLRDLLAQDFPAASTEILLIDSLSEDDSKRLMLDFQQTHHQYQRVLVLDNPGRYLPQACNLALEAFQGDALVRIDAHASVPTDFLRLSAECLNDGYYVCGGRRYMALAPTGPWRMLLLAAENSSFGSGGATYRRAGKAGPARSVFHGAYRREVFVRVGAWDERLLRAEDNDMSYRIRQAGFVIYLDPNIISTQFIRSTLRGFLRQKAANGYWIGRALLIQPGCVGLFNLIPALFLLALFGTIVMGFLLSWLPFLLLASLYFLAAVAAGILSFRSGPDASWRFTFLPLLFLLTHLGYGGGTLLGCLRGMFRH
jgi:cellulose synthase/poly-beta-1,6-N-acetylglucosamine synthase-like glycosyltransferase